MPWYVCLKVFLQNYFYFLCSKILDKIKKVDSKKKKKKKQKIKQKTKNNKKVSKKTKIS